MPGYSYIAVDRNGKEKRGSLEADTREKALDSLKNAGMIGFREGAGNSE